MVTMGEARQDVELAYAPLFPHLEDVAMMILKLAPQKDSTECPGGQCADTVVMQVDVALRYSDTVAVFRRIAGMEVAVDKGAITVTKFPYLEAGANLKNSGSASGGSDDSSGDAAGSTDAAGGDGSAAGSGDGGRRLLQSDDIDGSGSGSGDGDDASGDGSVDATSSSAGSKGYTACGSLQCSRVKVSGVNHDALEKRAKELGYEGLRRGVGKTHQCQKHAHSKAHHEEAKHHPGKSPEHRL